MKSELKAQKKETDWESFLSNMKVLSEDSEDRNQLQGTERNHIYLSMHVSLICTFSKTNPTFASKNSLFAKIGLPPIPLVNFLVVQFPNIPPFQFLSNLSIHYFHNVQLEKHCLPWILFLAANTWLRTVILRSIYDGPIIYIRMNIFSFPRINVLKRCCTQQFVQCDLQMGAMSFTKILLNTFLIGIC